MCVSVCMCVCVCVSECVYVCVCVSVCDLTYIKWWWVWSFHEVAG